MAPVIFQMLSRHAWLVAAVLDNIAEASPLNEYGLSAFNKLSHKLDIITLFSDKDMETLRSYH